MIGGPYTWANPMPCPPRHDDPPEANADFRVWWETEGEPAFRAWLAKRAAAAWEQERSRQAAAQAHAFRGMMHP